MRLRSVASEVIPQRRRSTVEASRRRQLRNILVAEIYRRQATEHGAAAWDPEDVLEALAEVSGHFCAQIIAAMGEEPRQRLSAMTHEATLKELPQVRRALANSTH